MLYTPGSYGHSPDLLGWIVHAAVWHVVGRVLGQLPLPVDVVVCAGLFLLYRARRRSRVPAR